MTSNMLGIPIQTLRNRMVEHGIKVRDHKYVKISDKQLDETIYNVLKTTPTIGKNHLTLQLEVLLLFENRSCYHGCHTENSWNSGTQAES